MLYKHLKEELRDAESKGWREEARIVSRNSIIAAAAAFCPLGVIMAVTVMILYDSLGDMPWFMANTAYYYPVTGIICIALSILLHNQNHFTAAMLVALAPFLWIFVFIGGGVYWAIR